MKSHRVYHKKCDVKIEAFIGTGLYNECQIIQAGLPSIDVDLLWDKKGAARNTGSVRADSPDNQKQKIGPVIFTLSTYTVCDQ